MTKIKSKLWKVLGLAMLMGTLSFAQTIESVTFSAAASSNDSFQPAMGAPYGASLSGANGSLEISASIGKSAYEATTLTIADLKLQSSIRVFPNPTTYMVNVDLSQLPQGEYQLYLIDFSGKMLYSSATKATTDQLDMSAYAAGTYLLNVQTKEANHIANYNIIKTK